MKKINQIEALARFDKQDRTFGFISYVINVSQNTYEDMIPYPAFSQLLGFPWRDWSLFRYMQKNGLLSNANKLSAISIKNMAAAYHIAFDEIRDDQETKKIESLKTSFLNQGYVDNGVHLLVFEKGKENIRYVNDGMHRFIGYEDLIQTGRYKKAFVPLNCIIVEVNDIENDSLSRVKGTILRPLNL